MLNTTQNNHLERTTNMIIKLNMIKDNPFYKVCKKLQKIFERFTSKNNFKKVGRPKKYSDNL
jgi:hypothetical protein